MTICLAPHLPHFASRIVKPTAVASRDPSGLHDTEITGCRCVPLQRENLRSAHWRPHTRAVLSSLAVAMRDPSGLHDTEVTL